jgi:hypothetical protein
MIVGAWIDAPPSEREIAPADDSRVLCTDWRQVRTAKRPTRSRGQIRVTMRSAVRRAREHLVKCANDRSWFIVLDDRTWRLVDETSFAEIVYDDSDWDGDRHTPSDHCPIVVALDWPASD